MWTVGAVVEVLLLFALALSADLAWHWVDWPVWALALLALVLAAYAVVMPTWRYAVHRWEVTDTAVHTQTGWWAVEQRIAPMSRIQTVDYEEGALSRLFGLAKVTITTASAAGALEISGLDRVAARELTATLTTRADAVPGDAT
jgi:membrane protein YdbS with pleckstrin-like domain